MDESSKPHLGEGEEGGGGDDDKARAEELLEDCWYFGNLLHRKEVQNIIMSTANNTSDRPPKSYQETYESIKKLSRSNESGPSAGGLTRSPSLPPFPARKVSINPTEKGTTHDDIDHQRRKSRFQPTWSPDKLPTSLLEDDGEIHHDEEEIEFSMGKLIRQASLKKPHVMLPPTNHDLKGMATMSSGSTSPRKMEFSKLKLERLRPRRQMNQLKTQKSLSDLQSQELQGFKDLGFDLSKKNLRQEQLNRIEEDEGRSTNGPGAQDRPTPAKWGSKEDDMKAQIKFWARAVASNMR